MGVKDGDPRSDRSHSCKRPWSQIRGPPSFAAPGPSLLGFDIFSILRISCNVFLTSPMFWTGVVGRQEEAEMGHS